MHRDNTRSTFASINSGYLCLLRMKMNFNLSFLLICIFHIFDMEHTIILNFTL